MTEAKTAPPPLPSLNGGHRSSSRVTLHGARAVPVAGAAFAIGFLIAIAPVTVLGTRSSQTLDNSKLSLEAPLGEVPGSPVREIISAYEKAAGGSRALRAFRTLVASATIHGREGPPRPFSMRLVAPSHIQIVELLPSGASDIARISTLAASGGWSSQSALTGSAPVGAASMDRQRQAIVQSRRFALEFALGLVPGLLGEWNLVTFSPGGVARDPRSGKALDVLLVADDTAHFGKVYFSKETHLPVRVDVSFLTTFVKPAEFTRTTYFADHRTVDGLVLPYTFIRQGSVQRIQVTGYFRDRPISPEIFLPATGDAAVQRIVSATER